MKKAVFTVTLALVLTLSFVAVAPAQKTMERILKRGELLVGISGSQPPLNATTKTGKIIGMDADLGATIAKNMGVKVRFVAIPFARLLGALEAGKVDMVISGMTMTMKRNLNVAFVGPYYVSGKGILTKPAMLSVLETPDGLNKPQYKVAALKDSTSQEFVKTETPKATLVKVKSYDEALDLLVKDQIVALVADYPYCAYAAFRYRDKGLVAGQAPLTFEPLGIAVLPDTLLLNWLENFMMLIEGSGSLELISERWFKDGSWIKALP
jgi:polar amino acid transport system substrate-binding protein